MKAPAAPKAVKDCVGAAGDAVIGVLVEKLVAPFDAYQSAFRQKLSDLRLAKAKGAHGALAHQFGLQAASALFQSEGAEPAEISLRGVGAEARGAAVDAAKGAAVEMAVEALLEHVKEFAATAVVDEIVASPPTPALSVVPRDVLETVVGTLTNVVVETVFAKALEALDVGVEIESSLDLETLVPAAGDALATAEEAGAFEEMEPADKKDDGDDGGVILKHDPMLHIFTRGGKKQLAIEAKQATTDADEKLSALAKQPPAPDAVETDPYDTAIDFKEEVALIDSKAKSAVPTEPKEETAFPMSQALVESLLCKRDESDDPATSV
jgi:hypothetical protein